MPKVHFKLKKSANVKADVYHVETKPRVFEPLTFTNGQATKMISKGTRILTFEFGDRSGESVVMVITTPKGTVTRTVTIPDGFNSIRSARTFEV